MDLIIHDFLAGLSQLVHVGHVRLDLISQYFELDLIIRDCCPDVIRWDVKACHTDFGMGGYQFPPIGGGGPKGGTRVRWDGVGL